MATSSTQNLQCKQLTLTCYIKREYNLLNGMKEKQII
jgi:hypothetical protein